MENLNLKEEVKSSEGSGSGETQHIGFTDNMSADEIAIQRRRIVELSNDSVLHGYDMAIHLMEAVGQLNAVVVLRANRSIIEIGLKNGIPGRLDGTTE